jgi:hypothetical protein
VLSVSTRFSAFDPVPSVVVVAVDAGDSVVLDTSKNEVTASASIILPTRTETFSGVVKSVTYGTQAPGINTVSYTIVPRGFLFFSATGTYIDKEAETKDPARNIRSIVSHYNQKFPSNTVELDSINHINMTMAISMVRFVAMPYSEMVLSMVASMGTRLRLTFNNKLLLFNPGVPTSTELKLGPDDYRDASISVDKYSRF